MPLARFTFPLAGLVGSHTLGAHAQGRHLNEAFDTIAFCRFDHISRADVVYSREGILALLDNDAHQVDDSVAALHALVEARAGDHIAKGDGQFFLPVRHL